MAGDKSVRTVRDRGYAYALNVKNASVAYTYLVLLSHGLDEI